MAFQDAMDAINLKMPKKIPRTEYSAHFYWKLIHEVTGINVTSKSTEEEQLKASMAFEKAWDYGFNWNILTHRHIFNGYCTSMGHAVFKEDGVDYNTDVHCPFEDEEEVLKFDPWEAYGERDIATLTKEFNDNYAKQLILHPDQVNMTGIYVTMISGLLEIFGWDLFLVALGVAPDEFGEVANRYSTWIEQYFRALAASDAPVVMIHDDMVWTSGAFAQPSWYRKYIFPNFARLIQILRDAGKKVMYTCDGTFTEFIDDMAAAGVNGFAMEPTTDMAAIAKKYGQTHAFIGNADCRILTLGTKEDIKKEVERCVNIGKECPGFIMAVGNHIPNNVPVENAIYYNNVFQELACKPR